MSEQTTIADKLRAALEQLLHEVIEAGFERATDYNWPKSIQDARNALAELESTICSHAECEDTSASACAADDCPKGRPQSIDQLNRSLLHIRVTPRRQPYCFAIEKTWGEWRVAVWKQGRQEPGSYRSMRLWGRRIAHGR